MTSRQRLTRRRPRMRSVLRATVALTMLGLMLTACGERAPDPNCSPDGSPPVYSADGGSCDLPPPDCDDCGSAWGDPHMVTLDGMRYNLQMVGEFTMLQTDDFELQLRTAPWYNSRNVSVSVGAAIHTGSETISVLLPEESNDGFFALRINGSSYDINRGPTRAGGATIFLHDEHTLVLSWESGAFVRVDHHRTNFDVYVSVPDGNATQGLLGVKDGDVSNDLTSRDGVVVTRDEGYRVIYRTFGESWRITDETSAFWYAPGTGTADFTDMTFPDSIATLDDFTTEELARAEEVCRAAGVTEAESLADCMLDVLVTGDEGFAQRAALAQQSHSSSRAGSSPPPAEMMAGSETAWLASLPGVTKAALIHDAVSIDGNTVFVTLRSSEPADEVLAIDGATGAEKWRVAGVSAHTGSLVLPDGRVAVVAVPGGPLAGSDTTALVTLDPDDGSIVDWVAWPEEARGTNRSYSSPSILINDELMLINGGLGNLSMWDITGEPEFLWAPPRSEFYNAAKSLPVDGGFVIYERIDSRPTLRLIDARSGEELDRYQDAETPAWPQGFVAGGNILVLATTSALEGVSVVVHGIEARDGELVPLWTVQAPAESPDTAPGVALRAFSFSEGLVVAEGDASFVGLNPRTGAVEFFVDKPGWHNHGDTAKVYDGKIYYNHAGSITLYALDTATNTRIDFTPQELFGLHADHNVYGESYHFGPKAAGNVLIFFKELVVGIPAD